MHPLLRKQPHVAYKVNDLAAAIAGHTVILGPYEPIDNYRVAVIDNTGVPVEFIETTLSDDEILGPGENGAKSRAVPMRRQCATPCSATWCTVLVTGQSSQCR